MSSAAVLGELWSGDAPTSAATFEAFTKPFLETVLGELGVDGDLQDLPFAATA